MRAAGAQRLPRGRHGLTRDEVAGAQRERMLRALADAMVERGYAGTSVADVLRIARVSRETFYEQFGCKRECFAATYERAVGPMLEGAAGAESFERLLSVHLRHLASDPALARVHLIEVYAAGPRAFPRHVAVQGAFAAIVAGALGARGAKRRFAAEAIAGAITSMATARLAAGDPGGLAALHRPLSAFARRALLVEQRPRRRG